MVGNNICKESQECIDQVTKACFVTSCTAVCVISLISMIEYDKHKECGWPVGRSGRGASRWALKTGGQRA